MNSNEIAKAGIIGGIIIIIIEILVGFAAPSLVYAFSFIAIIIGSVIAGWMIKAKKQDAIVAGAVAGVIYIIIGFIILYQLVLKHHGTAAGNIIGIVVGIILGAVGGLIGSYLASSSKGSDAKSSKKKK